MDQHLCNGAGVLPSSLCADMVLELTDYAYRLLRPDSPDLGMNLCHMENPASLLLKNIAHPEHQIIQTEVEVDLTLHRSTARITSLASAGKTRTVHAQCIISFEDTLNWTLQWNRIAYLIQARIDMLKEKADAGTANRLTHAMAYKMFASFVQYGDKYKSMKEVILDSANLEATAKVVFQAGPKDGDFFLCPYLLDGIGHLAGFIMNGGDESPDSKDYVWISHGWDSLRFAKRISADRHYRSYVKCSTSRARERWLRAMSMLSTTKAVLLRSWEA